jgi:LysM repeat protein
VPDIPAKAAPRPANRPYRPPDLDKGWMDSVDLYAGGDSWRDYEATLRSVIAELDRHLRGVANYPSIDFRFAKAMLWTESGPWTPEWTSRPLQIGNGGDGGLGELLKPGGKGEIIRPPEWAGRVTAASARSNPVDNIRAGLGYVFNQSLVATSGSVAEPGAPIIKVKAEKGDSLQRIAQRYGSTTEHLQRLNSSIYLKPGQEVRVQRASVRRVAKSWKPIDLNFLVKDYNGGGDPHYGEKLRYVLAYIAIYP